MSKTKNRELAIVAQVAALNSMPFKDLSRKYEELVGRKPTSNSRKQVVARLAYRIQEIAYGGLSKATQKQMEQVYAKVEEKPAPIRKEQQKTPGDGTKLVREYLGENHEVTVLDKGFEYKGAVYRSLSSIAKKITGSHTSGPAFFGLAKKGGAK